MLDTRGKLWLWLPLSISAILFPSTVDSLSIIIPHWVHVPRREIIRVPDDHVESAPADRDRTEKRHESMFQRIPCPWYDLASPQAPHPFNNHRWQHKQDTAHSFHESRIIMWQTLHQLPRPWLRALQKMHYYYDDTVGNSNLHIRTSFAYQRTSCTQFNHGVVLVHKHLVCRHRNGMTRLVLSP